MEKNEADQSGARRLERIGVVKVVKRDKIRSSRAKRS